MPGDAFHGGSAWSGHRYAARARRTHMEAAEVDGPRLSSCERASRGSQDPHDRPGLVNGKHPIERDLRPVLLLVGDDDSVVYVSLQQPFENPEQVVRRHAEHRRAQTPELIE